MRLFAALFIQVTSGFVFNLFTRLLATAQSVNLNIMPCIAAHFALLPVRLMGQTHGDNNSAPIVLPT